MAITWCLIGPLHSLGAQQIDHGRSSDTLDATLGLPPMRPLATPPSVPDVGVDVSRSEQPTFMPVTATFGLADLEVYTAQLSWRFPLSDLAYPADSIALAQRDRAAAWVERLQALDPDVVSSAAGGDLVQLAEIAARSGRDSLARQLFERRLAQLPGAPVGQSYVLAEAIATFSDTARDSVSLASTMPWAEAYMMQLFALPVRGYSTSNDSTSVLYRRVWAEGALILAYSALSASARVIDHARRFFVAVKPLAARERARVLSSVFPYLQVYNALFSQPHSDTLIRAMDARMTAEAGVAVRGILRLMAIYHKAAPPIQFNRWLNTTDTTYSTTPRHLDLADGTIRVIGFGKYESLIPYALERIQRLIGAEAQVIYVTHTEGFVGVDLVSPSDETSWLQMFYVQRRGVHIPIAVWAPEKVPVGDGMVPPPSPVEDAYLTGMLMQKCIMIDGHGHIAGIYDLTSRKGESAVVHDVAVLHVIP